MIAVDTNVLVHAHRAESRWHAAACDRLEGLAAEQAPWGIPVFCVGEFLRVVTHRRVFDAVIAAVCLETGADELLTRDRDFARFPGVKALRLS